MKADELKTRLASTDLFQSLSKRSLAHVVKAGREVSHADGHEVIVAGSGAVGFHLIVSGTARVTTAGAVRRTLGVGDYFGEISVIDGRPRSAGVEAAENLTTFIIEPAVFNGLLEDNPEFARKIIVLLCARVRELSGRLDS